MSAVPQVEFLPTRITLHPVAGRIGAEVRGVHLSSQLDDSALASIRSALHQHKVVFFRNQHLTDAEHEAFAARFGTPVAHPTIQPLVGTHYTVELDSAHGGRANAWHTDVTFVDAYPQASILRAVTVPDAGGDTLWANTASAYQDLPTELRKLADQLWARHSNEYDYAYDGQASAASLQRYRDEFAAVLYEADHPVVRVHPVTHERTLILGQFLRNLLGYSREQSQHFYALLQSYVTRQENTVRWRWAAGDVAIWDNRATQHYAVNDYGDRRRVMRRVTVAGDIPVGVDGRKSVLRKTPAR